MAVRPPSVTWNETPSPVGTTVRVTVPLTAIHSRVTCGPSPTSLQPSSVHVTPSSQAGGAPPTQAPSWQASLTVQYSPSSQPVPLVTGSAKQVSVTSSQTPTLH